MPRLPIAYVAALVSFCALDFVWLGLMGPRLYKARIGRLLLPQPDIPAAAAFYVLYAVGIVGLAVMPAGSWRGALGRGALLGLVAYATYDLTNQATLAGWDSGLTLFDMAWGTIATGAAAAIGFKAAARPSPSPAD